MTILAMLCGLGSLVCWILVLLKMFPAEGALKGILAIICGLYAFIWGWMNATKHNLKNIMLIWTALFVISLVLNVVAGASMIPQM
jgi:hypothetical protein